MIEAVVFDFDGVIANSEPFHFQGFRQVLAQEGVDLAESDYYTRYLGFDDAGAFSAIADDRGLAWSGSHIAAMVARKAARLEALERDVSILFPGARSAVERLAALCPLAIASGALRAEISRVLDRENLSHYFAAIVAAEDTAAGKPAPDAYLHAVERLRSATGRELLAHKCAAIEDSRWGLQSARRAGLRTVGITHTYPANTLEEADLVLDHLDALTWDRLVTALR
jgi:HAD superfamily hydrolase (TIGR01509 family)